VDDEYSGLDISLHGEDAYPHSEGSMGTTPVMLKEEAGPLQGTVEAPAR
jgi:hypothetical protein